MTVVYSVWETDDRADDRMRLLFNEETDSLFFTVEVKGRNEVVNVTEQDLGRLAHHIAAFFMDRALKAEAEKEAKE